MAGLQAQTVRVEERPDGIAVLLINVPDRTFNVLNRQLRDDLSAALDQVTTEPKIRLLVIRSDKPSGFVAGADLHEFTAVHGPDEARNLSAEGQRLFDKLAELPVPTIAMIHGPCLGGGLELALACDFRLIVDGSKTQIGFPEIELGLLPAWGGCQRLPKLVGLERGLQVILNRRRLTARDAQRWGLADSIATTEEQLADRLNQLIDRALAEGKRSQTRRPVRTWRQRLLESNPAGRLLIFRGTERILRRRVPDDMPAPFEALGAIRTGYKSGIEAGLAYEREAAVRLSTTNAARNLVSLFLQTEQARRYPDIPPNRSIRRVGIVGAGVMGAGIAQLAALRGFDVTIQEVNESALTAGMRRIADLVAKAAEKGLVSAQAAQKLSASIRGSTTWEGFGDVDLVVEAAVEELGIKKRIFKELAQRTRPATILATNTSSLLVSALKGEVGHPARLAGLHFFNPVHKMPLVEVVSADTTDAQTVGLLKQWTVELGKIPVPVRDGPGFVVNRILMPYLDEATRLVAEGNPVEQIDHIMRRFGMPMGPLEVLDQVGLDVAAHVAGAMSPVVQSRFPPNEAFRQFVERGWLGQKSGVGFYRYRGKKKKVNHDVHGLFKAAGSSDEGDISASLPASVRMQEARERMVLLMVNEAAMCLAEHLAEDATLIDLAMVLGTGWAPHRGGPLRYALDRGVGKVVEKLRELRGRHGARFEPCGALIDLH
jgi:3-hydroxyacyl-CoA dehydrogenase/enoyl-CoA hydratase/3-hydroxybutyryl-CoA epimerase